MLIDLQRRIQEVGRIRIGQQVPTSGGKTRPEKLETFRFTSADRSLVDQVAELYGGDVAEWESPNGPQWQVITKAASIDILLPPQDLAMTQAYELWSAGGCVRRCDGTTEIIGQQPCVCDPAARECDIHTRLSVMLRDLRGIGVWRLDTSGYYAAVELSGVLQILTMAGRAGTLLPARLRLEQRSVKRNRQTRRFAVPMLDVEATPAALLLGHANGDAPQLETRGLTPVPLEEAVIPSIAEQSEAPRPRPRRAGSAPEVPATGRRRRAGPMPSPEEAADEPPAPTRRPRAAATESTAEPAEAAQEPPAAPVRPRRTSRPAAAAAESEEKPAEPAEEETIPYWQRRIHAAGRERGFDHDDLRTISAAVCGVEPGDIAEFSSNHMDLADFRQVDSLLRSLPESIDGTDPGADLDALGAWTWPRVNAKGLDSWDAVDVVVVAATGTQPDDLSLAEWIAFVTRLGVGEYDAVKQ